MSALKVGGALTDKKFEPKMKLENEAGLIKNNFFSGWDPFTGFLHLHFNP